jgi:hypothetical protein
MSSFVTTMIQKNVDPADLEIARVVLADLWWSWFPDTAKVLFRE